MNTAGHAQYLEFLRLAGEVFSPMFPLAEPLRRGGRDFWCVEGLWQASKVIRLADPGRVSRDGLEFEVLHREPNSVLVWFPAAGLVLGDFRHSLCFDVLKSGRSHNAARNRWLGLGNWAFAGHYLAEEARVVTDRSAAQTLIHRPAYLHQLAMHSPEVDRLQRLLAEGRVHISPEMCEAHPHLNVLLDALTLRGDAVPSA